MAKWFDFGKSCTVYGARSITVFKVVANSELLQLVLEAVHPENLGALPPSPVTLAFKGEQIGLGKASDFFDEVTVYRGNRIL